MVRRRKNKATKPPKNKNTTATTTTTKTTTKTSKPSAKTPPLGATYKMSSAERSSYFGRREAAKILRTVLQGDSQRRAVASIKSLVFSGTVRNKRGTFALVCQTLKYLPIIKEVLETAAVLNSKWKRQEELMYIITYDVLFGQEISTCGSATAEKFLVSRKAALESALAKLLVRKKIKRVEDLLTQDQTPDVSRPRYVRVNTLKVDVKYAATELGKLFTVQEDDLVPDLLVLPPGADLHDHPLVTDGSVFLQGKASSMVAVALGPQPGWTVLDACSAPGNKTVHLAALMRGKGKIVACELVAERVKLLQKTVELAGASNVEVQHGDFLGINPEDPVYSKLRAIVLDPSCSGSGTAAARLDHLLPSHTNQTGGSDIIRLTKLSGFQKKALEHALSFPSVERIVYSTCSIDQIENEDVIKSVLPLALKNGFQLETTFPQWARRGLPVLEGSEHLLRMDPTEDKEGFFIALFVRKRDDLEQLRTSEPEHEVKHARKRKAVMTLPFTRLSKMWMLSRILNVQDQRTECCSEHCCSGTPCVED